MKKVQSRLLQLSKQNLLVPVLVILLLVVVIFLTAYLSQQTTSIPRAVEQKDAQITPDQSNNWSLSIGDLNNDSVIDERDAALMTHE